jgi:hypothetical protein
LTEYGVKPKGLKILVDGLKAVEGSHSIQSEINLPKWQPDFEQSLILELWKANKAFQTSKQTNKQI